MFVNGFSVAPTATFAARERGETGRNISRPERERRDASRSSLVVAALVSALTGSLVLAPLLSITDSGTG